MTRYRVLREMCGCGPITAGFISFMNWAMGVPKGRAVFMSVEIEWTDTK